ncbi:hypothetical protein FSP39_003803 [Pinctada imbricata]|uniref:TIR domain-containing protein n=1 Tax=Pinctada imbricata TaxID=66713 RepID=A0AA88XNV3_PINIB|nr:hypothetical protein FSP39_003803 [Pinctada imbricata]
MTSGTFNCVCDDHWEGAKCDKFKCDLTCPSGSRCEGRNDVPVCVMTSTTTVPPTESSSAASDLRPIQERTCLNTFVCIHGYCDRHSTRGFRCVCDTTWGGVFCDKSLCPSECPEDCIAEGNSRYICNNKPQEDNSTTAPSTAQVVQSACDANYTMRPLEERKCLPLTCKFGQCKKTKVNITVQGQVNVTTNIACVCDDNVDGILCQNKCCLECGENGRCELDEDSEPFCNCRTNRFYGEFCNLTRTDPGPQYLKETWYMWVVGVCAFVLLVLILTLVVLPYMLWRNRVTFIMKIVHYFQPYEDNDDRLWDAFVAFRSGGSDEEFVTRTLRPKLEDELGFNLCLHFRDFTPGEKICFPFSSFANNIIECVNNSRRTILIVSPRFVEREFIQFEYQIAKEQMLKRKQRIIPIILEDISDVTSSTDPNLKQILKSVTYIEWPDHSNERKIKTFWSRVELSMPKRKSVEEKQKESKDLKYEKSSNHVTSSQQKSSINNDYKDNKRNSSNSQVVIISKDNLAFDFEDESKNIEKNDLNVNIEKYMHMMGNGKC